MKTQFGSMLLKQNPLLENEVRLNYEKEYRISELKILMKKYKCKNKEIYKSLHREYLELIK